MLQELGKQKWPQRSSLSPHAVEAFGLTHNTTDPSETEKYL